MLLKNHVQNSVSDLPTGIAVLWIDKHLAEAKIGQQTAEKN